MKFIRRDEDGTCSLKDDGIAELKEVEQIICFNPTEKSTKKNNFFCCVCNNELRSLQRCEDHCNSPQHANKVDERFKQKQHLTTIKPLAFNHEEKLTNFLEKSLVDLSLVQLEERQVVCDRVSKILTDKLSNGISSRLCGSSLTGIGFIDAGVDINVNFDLKVMAEHHPHITDTNSCFISVFGVLKHSQYVTDVEEFFYCKYPKIHFKDIESGLDCYISTIFYNGYFTSELILKYLAIDERTKQLCLLFKHWGQICKLDDQDRGSIPSIAFSLMVIHYLQQQQPPVLPVIHHSNDVAAPVLNPGYVDQEMESKHRVSVEESVLWKSENKDSLGKLFIGLFSYYLVDFHLKTMVVTIRQITPLSRLHRKFDGKKMAIEDPFMIKESVTNIMTSQAVMGYFMDCLELSYKHYSGVPATYKKKGKSPVKKTKKKPIKKDQTQLKTDQNTKGKTKKISVFGEREQQETLKKSEEKLNSEKANVKTTNLVKFSSSNADSEVFIEKYSKDESVDVSINLKNNQNETESDQISDKTVGSVSKNLSDSADKLEGSGSIEYSGVETEEEIISSNQTSSNTHVSGSTVEESVEDTKAGKNMNASENVKIEERKKKAIIQDNSTINTKRTQTKSSNTKRIIPKDSAVNTGSRNTNLENDVVRETNTTSDYKRYQVEEIDKRFGEFNDASQKLQVLSIVEQKNVKVESVNDVINASTNQVTEQKIPTNHVAEDQHSANQVIEDQDMNNHFLGDQNSTNQEAGDRDSTNHETGDQDSTNQVTADQVITNQILEGQDSINQETRDQDSTILVTEYQVITSQILREQDSTNQEIGDQDSANRNTRDQDSTNQGTGDQVTTNKVSGNQAIKFSFSFKTLTPPYNIPLVCLFCTDIGHHHSQCPKKMVTYKPLEETPKDFVSIVTRVCEHIVRANELQIEEFDTRLKMVKFLEDCLRQTFDKKCRLALFGSSVNGFGFTQSDMDICLRFDSDLPPENLNYPKIIKMVAKMLRKNTYIREVMPITRAKVPIVKFEVPILNHQGKTVRKLEGDISLYNSLALRNSQLLATYAGIDPRVRVIGYCIKVFAKLCGIGDASQATLSSYACIVMVVHYLQHTKPPVIPILQDIYDKSQNKPQVIVEAWNTYFYDDITSLPKVWKEYGKNKQSVGELWIGFFRYYIETFNFHKEVVVINRCNNITKFQKGWNYAMTIEDPFDLKRNLSAAVTASTLGRIIGCFKQARLRFGQPAVVNLKTTDNLMTYFFDVNVLTSNKSVPKDRLICDQCNKMGHTSAECTQKVFELFDENDFPEMTSSQLKSKTITPKNSSSSKSFNDAPSPRTKKCQRKSPEKAQKLDASTSSSHERHDRPGNNKDNHVRNQPGQSNFNNQRNPTLFNNSPLKSDAKNRFDNNDFPQLTSPQHRSNKKKPNISSAHQFNDSPAHASASSRS